MAVKYSVKHILIGVLFFACTWGQAQEFTFGTIPDTQNMTENDEDCKQVTKMTQFYVDNKDSLNLVFVASLGDMTQYGAPEQWKRVRESYNVFENAEIPYAPCQGNHDPIIEDFNKWFPVNDFLKNPNSFFTGSLNNNIANAYYLFTVEGMDYIVVVLQSQDSHLTQEHGFKWTSIHWANYIISQHANRRAILVTHDFYENKTLVDYIITKHDNLFLAVCGHSCDREKYWTENSPKGNKIHCIMTDYQCDEDKGATVRYYTFKPRENIICAYTYNVLRKEFENDFNSEFCFDYNMTGNRNRITLAQSKKIVEGAEDGQAIKVILNNDKYTANLNAANWKIENLPVGVNLGSLIRNNDTTATIILSGNSQLGNYQSDITNVAVTILKEELVGAKQFPSYQGITLSKAVTPFTVPALIQAEDFNYMHGIQIGNTNDGAPGKNIGYLNPGDWVTYNVKVNKSGLYELKFRTSSFNTDGKIEIQSNGNAIKTLEFKQTGGWHTWATSTSDIELAQGEQEIKLLIVTGDFNINWFEFTLK